MSKAPRGSLVGPPGFAQRLSWRVGVRFVAQRERAERKFKLKALLVAMGRRSTEEETSRTQSAGRSLRVGPCFVHIARSEVLRVGVTRAETLTRLQTVTCPQERVSSRLGVKVRVGKL